MLATGVAFCVVDLDALLTVLLAAPPAGFFTGARGADAFFGVAPFVADAVGFWDGTAILFVPLLLSDAQAAGEASQIGVSRALTFQL